MAYPGIYEISYSYGIKREPLEMAEVERIIRGGKAKACKANTVRLAKIRDGVRRDASFFEFYVLMDEDLVCTFRSVVEGIPANFTEVQTDTHAERHVAAWHASWQLGIEMSPIAAIRHDIVPKVGTGTLTGVFHCLPIFMFDRTTGKSDANEDFLLRPQSLVMALLFSHLIGSGQRYLTSIVVDNNNVIRTRYNHEAFSYTESRALEKLLAETDKEISRVYWDAINEFRTRRLRHAKLAEMLKSLVGEEAAQQFARRVFTLLTEKRAGSQFITIL